jgi:hypothetical protein
MLDVVYIVVTVVFFALMLAFVHGLEVLGRGAVSEESDK